MATPAKKKPSKATILAAQSLDALYQNACIVKSPDARAKYEGACTALGWLGFTVDVQGGRHEVVAYADTAAGR